MLAANSHHKTAFSRKKLNFSLKIHIFFRAHEKYKPKARAQKNEHGLLATVYGEINGNFSLLWSIFQTLLRLQELCGFLQWCGVRRPYNRFRW